MTLADWLDCDAVSVRLVESSMRLEAAESAAERFLEAATALRELGIHADAEVVACWAPGRVEVFGKHTDYCGGPGAGRVFWQRPSADLRCLLHLA